MFYSSGGQPDFSWGTMMALSTTRGDFGLNFQYANDGRGNLVLRTTDIFASFFPSPYVGFSLDAHRDRLDNAWVGTGGMTVWLYKGLLLNVSVAGTNTANVHDDAVSDLITGNKLMKTKIGVTQYITNNIFSSAG